MPISPGIRYGKSKEDLLILFRLECFKLMKNDEAGSSKVVANEDSIRLVVPFILLSQGEISQGPTRRKKMFSHIQRNAVAVENYSNMVSARTHRQEELKD
jgi:hypothetical protein